MTKAEACKIFRDLKNEEYTTEQKIEAIVEVALMETHNSIKKDNMVEAILFMAAVLGSVLEGESSETE